mmetsp:Transcript_52662/g.150090  ORF Transcript_52662/g.150090 Transcript_52662/m.150090 type:complete len:228 (-) Transcript_52662:728-1411(-)
MSSGDAECALPWKLCSSLPTTRSRTRRSCTAHMVSDFGASTAWSSSSWKASDSSVLAGSRTAGICVLRGRGSPSVSANLCTRCAATCSDRSREMAACEWPKSLRSAGMRSRGRPQRPESGSNSRCLGFRACSSPTPQGQKRPMSSLQTGANSISSASATSPACCADRPSSSSGLSSNSFSRRKFKSASRRSSARSAGSGTRRRRARCRACCSRCSRSPSGGEHAAAT